MNLYLRTILILFLTFQIIQTQTNSNPNIIFILADDLGYGDLSCLNENSKINTVNIDRLAESGVYFTDAHSGSAVCTPTRYGILTGRYSWRTKLQRGVLSGYSPPVIDSNRATIASFLQKNGYFTGCVGKWHLGWDWGLKEKYTKADLEKISYEHVDFSKPINNGPRDIGFDYFYGISASLDMGPYVYIENDNVVEFPTEHFEGFRGYKFARSGKISPSFDHQSSLRHLTEKAVSFINRSIGEKRGNPFFLYFPLTAPHTPIIPERKFEGKSGIGPYGDFVLQCDWTVGKILEALEKNGIEKNTLIIFTSDNGCSPQANFQDLEMHGHDPSYIFRGYKSDIYEGGHRIPFIASWPGTIPEKSFTTNPVCLTDFFATTANVIGAKIPSNSGEDSFNFLDVLKDPLKILDRAALIHHSIDGLFAIRKGKWKLELTPGSGGWSYPKDYEAVNLGLPMIQLYDLENDISEQYNLQGDYPDIVNELIDLLEKYVADGRSTPGVIQQNDVEVEIWKYLKHRKEKLNLEKIKHKAITAKVKLLDDIKIDYSANGIDVLVDGIKASDDFKDGYWAGIEEDDLKFEVIFKEEQYFKSIKIRSMENQNSWIFFPTNITAYYEDENDNWTLKVLKQKKLYL